MYKTLNSSQHHIITKEKHICDICIPYIQGNTYVCVYLNHFPVHLKLMQDCTSTRLQLKKKKKNGSWFSISGPGPSGTPGAPSDPPLLGAVAPGEHFSKNSSAALVFKRRVSLGDWCLDSRSEKDRQSLKSYLLTADLGVRQGPRGGGPRGLLCGQLGARKARRLLTAFHGLCLPAAELTERWVSMFITLPGKKRQQKLVCSCGVLSVVFWNKWDFHEE